MVASVAALKSAAQASSYYEVDDYYSEGGEAPSAWFGEGAKALGLVGEVDRAAFKSGLEGELPNGRQLGTIRNGEREHRPGWDVTFSAPKSVSIMAEVAGDRRLIGAHDKAVRTALDYIERHGAATRVREGGEIKTVETGKLAVATFRHNTSRAQDPQLHTHAVILNTTREGRELLTEAIRAELRKDGTIRGEAVSVATLESKGLTREEARHARGYEIGDVVTFRRGYERHGIEKGQAYRVARVDGDANRIALHDRQGRAIEWRLDKWGRGQVESFAEVQREFATGDRVQFTRNDRQAGRVNGATAAVVDINAEARTLIAVDARGRERTLSLDNTGDRHIRHGWVGTVHGSQGATADRSMTHLESFRANTVDARSAYVAISRARQHAAIYTDSKEKLADAIETRSGERQSAVESSRGAELSGASSPAQRPGISMG